MKISRALVLTALLSVGTFSAVAQHRHGEQQAQADTSGQQGMMNMMRSGMMQNDAMGNMHETHMKSMGQTMGNPFKHSDMLVRVLPTMRDVLSLSDEQVASNEDGRRMFQEQLAVLNKDIASAEEKLKSLLASNDPDPDEVKALLRVTATYRADLQVLGYETADRMKEKLTDEQREKLAEMTPMQMHHHMMMNMTMMEMMQIMGGDMMPCGITGMMQDNAMHGRMRMMEKSGMMKQ